MSPVPDNEATTAPAAPREGGIGSVVVSGFFIVAGIVTLYDTTTYTDVDSKVFPRAAAILLIVAAAISLVSDLVIRRRRASAAGAHGDAQPIEGDTWRRVLLIAAMLTCCLAMPITGFLPAAAIAFTGALFAAMHERWTLARALLYTLSGALLMGGFYALFRFALHVPLP